MSRHVNERGNVGDKALGSEITCQSLTEQGELSGTTDRRPIRYARTDLAAKTRVRLQLPAAQVKYHVKITPVT